WRSPSSGRVLLPSAVPYYSGGRGEAANLYRGGRSGAWHPAGEGGGGTTRRSWGPAGSAGGVSGGITGELGSPACGARGGAAAARLFASFLSSAAQVCKEEQQGFCLL
ncbi:unnamed protein product, partial [Urochloa humidicola]